MTNQTKQEELLGNSILNDIVHDALGEVFCQDCEHPRCLNKVKLYKRAIVDLINAEVTAVLDELEKQKTGKTIYNGEPNYYVNTKAIQSIRSRYE